jgi:hypothetical protein
MSERDADKLGVVDDERRLWVRLDDAKANLSLIDGEALWFKRVGVVIPNGDEVGVLVAGDPGPSENTASDEETEAAVLAEIDRAWRVKEPYGVHPLSGERFFRRSLARRLGRPNGAVCNAVERLRSCGAIEEAVFDSRNRKRGLRCVPFDERSRGPESSEGDA